MIFLFVGILKTIILFYLIQKQPIALLRSAVSLDFSIHGVTQSHPVNQTTAILLSSQFDSENTVKLKNKTADHIAATDCFLFFLSISVRTKTTFRQTVLAMPSLFP